MAFFVVGWDPVPWVFGHGINGMKCGKRASEYECVKVCMAFFHWRAAGRGAYSQDVAGLWGCNDNTRR
jgi:hypothetical protein